MTTNQSINSKKNYVGVGTHHTAFKMFGKCVRFFIAHCDILPRRNKQRKPKINENVLKSCFFW